MSAADTDHGQILKVGRGLTFNGRPRGTRGNFCPLLSSRSSSYTRVPPSFWPWRRTTASVIENCHANHRTHSIVATVFGFMGVVGAIATLSSPETVAAVSACPQSRVFYTLHPDREAFSLPSKIPWIATSASSSRGAGFLFYYGATMFRNRPERAIITTNGKVDALVGTKILWWIQNGGSRLVVTGKQLDGTDSFRQDVPALAPGAVSYPSIISVPTPGCWELTLVSGTVSATVVFRAIPNAARSVDNRFLLPEDTDPTGRHGVGLYGAAPTGGGLSPGGG